MTTLLVASSGGHLAQLVRLRPRMALGKDVVWFTFDTPQSRSLLDGEAVRYAHFVAPRDWRAIARNVPLAASALRELDVDTVVSTGSGFALSVLPLARVRGARCHFIESAARSDGPSVTGRVLCRLPGVHLYTQYESWAADRWRYGGSVFDGFAAEEREGAVRPQRILVTLGTIPFPFSRLVERLQQIVPDDVEVVWQTGATNSATLPPGASRELPAHELDKAIHEVDVVVAHAGIGSALDALEAGQCPILVSREHAFGEHVDDHQAQIGRELGRRGIAVHRRVDELTFEDLVAAHRRRIVRLTEAPPFALDGPRGPSAVVAADR